MGMQEKVIVDQMKHMKMEKELEDKNIKRKVNE